MSTDNKTIEYTITDGVATITEAGYTEGSSVLLVLVCQRSSEGGGLSDLIINEQDEAEIEDWLGKL